MFNTKKLIIYISIGLATFAVLGFGIFGIVQLINNNSSSDDTPATGVDPTTGEPVEVGGKIDLQLPVNQWVDSQPDQNNLGVVIYDLDHTAIVARHNEDGIFDMGQLYQLFVAYEGYDRISRNIWQPTDEYESLNLDRKTCLDYMLRWSYVECSDLMWDEIGHDTLQSVYLNRKYAVTNLDSFISSSSEINSIMLLYWNHPNIPDESWNDIRTSLLDQTGNTTFDGINLRQGLPSGFTAAKVYNKAGWYFTESTQPAPAEGEEDHREPAWHTYDDTAFVEFPATTNKDGASVPARHYIITVMTRETSPRQIVALGRSIEQAVKTADNY